MSYINRSNEFTIGYSNSCDLCCRGAGWDDGDQERINEFVNSLKYNSVVKFENGNYYLSGKGNKSGDRVWGSINIRKKLHIIAYGAVFNCKQGPTIPDEDDEFGVAFYSQEDNACSDSTWHGGEFLFYDRADNPTRGGGGIYVVGEQYGPNNDDVYSCSNILIENVKFSKDSDTIWGENCIDIDRCLDVQINNCEFHNAGSTGIQYTGYTVNRDISMRNRFTNCSFIGTSNGISVNSPNSNFYIDDVIVDNCQFDNNDICFRANSKRIIFNNITVNNFGTHVAYVGADPAQEALIDQMQISNMIINQQSQSSGAAIRFGKCSGNVQMNNIDIANCNDWAIYSERSEFGELQISNISINNPNGGGIYSYWDNGDKKKRLSVVGANIISNKDGIKLNGIQDISLVSIRVDGLNNNIAGAKGINIQADSIDSRLIDVQIINWDNQDNRIILDNAGTKESIMCSI